MQNIGRVKHLKVFLLIAVLALVVFSAQTAFAKNLENDYPQIPLPGFGNYSLNEVFEAVTDGTGAAADDFEGRDPLSSLILYFYVMAVMVVGLVAFGALIIAGVKFMLSGANPGLRRDAKDQLVAAIIGIVILLGSWIILNTINPELRILHRVGEGTSTLPGVTAFDGLKDEFVEDDPTAITFNPNTLLYGGVVLYREIAMNGTAGRSEVVLNNIRNFGEGAYVGKDNTQGARVLGECNVSLYEGKDFAVPELTLTGPTAIVPLIGVESIQFTGGGCLGDSVTLYEDTDYADGTFPSIYSAKDLGDDALHKPGFKDAGDDMDSILFAPTPRYDAESGSEDLVLVICKDKDFGNCTGDISKNIPDINIDDQLPDDSWGDAISSFSLSGSGQNRQAGAVLYNKDDFGGTSEIFITSDSKLNDGSDDDVNIITADEAGAYREWVSSLRIIGEYTVTLYDEDLFGGNYLRFYNTKNVVGYEKGVVPDPSPGPMITLSRSNGILQIPKLSKFSHPDDGKTWNDKKVKSIQLWLPRDIYLDDADKGGQNLGPASDCPLDKIYCVL